MKNKVKSRQNDEKIKEFYDSISLTFRLTTCACKSFLCTCATAVYN